MIRSCALSSRDARAERPDVGRRLSARGHSPLVMTARLHQRGGRSATEGNAMTTTAPPRQAVKPEPPRLRRLTRSRTDRMVAGVCGGFAAYAGVDVNLIRLVLVALTLFGGTGLVLYLVAWLIL